MTGPVPEDPGPERRFGQRVREERTKRGLTQRALAEMVSLEPLVLTRIETGGRPIRLNEAKTIADLFNTTVDDMMGAGEATLADIVAQLDAARGALDASLENVLFAATNLTKFRAIFYPGAKLSDANREARDEILATLADIVAHDKDTDILTLVAEFGAGHLLGPEFLEEFYRRLDAQWSSIGRRHAEGRARRKYHGVPDDGVMVASLIEELDISPVEFRKIAREHGVRFTNVQSLISPSDARAIRGAFN